MFLACPVVRESVQDKENNSRGKERGMFSPVMYVILAFVPVGVLSLTFEFWQRINQTRDLRRPVTDKLLRPAGETCRRKTEELNEKIGELAIWIIGWPSTLLVGYLSSSKTTASHIVWIMVAVIASVFLGFLIWKMLDTVNERNNWQLGFNGERLVAEQLNQLMSEGCRVFHDFPLGEKGNIDHIVIAPTGVFAIETKTKRKGPASGTQQAHEVVYEGKSLKYPFYTDTRDLEQARTQVVCLEKYLNPLLNEPVGVQAILTLPGWYVICRAWGDVLVLNPKMIDTAVLSPSQSYLSPERIKEISRLIDQKCRDVEF